MCGSFRLESLLFSTRPRLGLGPGLCGAYLGFSSLCCITLLGGSTRSSSTLSFRFSSGGIRMLQAIVLAPWVFDVALLFSVPFYSSIHGPSVRYRLFISTNTGFLCPVDLRLSPIGGSIVRVVWVFSIEDRLGPYSSHLVQLFELGL